MCLILLSKFFVIVLSELVFITYKNAMPDKCYLSNLTSFHHTPPMTTRMTISSSFARINWTKINWMEIIAPFSLWKANKITFENCKNQDLEQPPYYLQISYDSYTLACELYKHVWRKVKVSSKPCPCEKRTNTSASFFSCRQKCTEIRLD